MYSRTAPVRREISTSLTVAPNFCFTSFTVLMGMVAEATVLFELRSIAELSFNGVFVSPGSTGSMNALKMPPHNMEMRAASENGLMRAKSEGLMDLDGGSEDGSSSQTVKKSLFIVIPSQLQWWNRMKIFALPGSSEKWRRMHSHIGRVSTIGVIIRSAMNAFRVSSTGPDNSFSHTCWVTSMSAHSPKQYRSPSFTNRERSRVCISKRSTIRFRTASRETSPARCIVPVTVFS
mmetsp:Transcript_43034/g.113403  ORF Transcript_43034/g.113403 Transcript_43034/m.113403 type:complete len:234 (+) Transcript_43034:694-1395(+)